jgi:hypothetical protein
MSSTGSPCLPRSRYRSRTVSALGMTQTSQFGLSSHLCPVALWQAFPPADYDGNSVARGLSSRRRSRVPSVLHVSSATEASHSSPGMGSFPIDYQGAVSGCER